uniref:Uncharacterized protein n=1 Tax=Romanomermis culicivorax TaxID=13658 RepID=A0A915KNT2_ROMCU
MSKITSKSGPKTEKVSEAVDQISQKSCLNDDWRVEKYNGPGPEPDIFRICYPIDLTIGLSLSSVKMRSIEFKVSNPPTKRPNIVCLLSKCLHER